MALIESHAPAQPHRLWVVWLLFFFQFAGIGAYFAYQNIYYLEAGLSGTEIGIIGMTIALVSVASSVAWGYISDRTGNPRLLMALGAVGSLVTAQFVPLVHEFYAFLGLAMVASFVYSAPATLMDSTALAMLGDRREDYGKYRLGGTFGFIIASLSAGYLFDWLGLRVMFPFYAVIMAAFAGTALLLPALPTHITAQARGDMGRLLRSWSWLIFSASVFLVWIGINASITFLAVALSHMGANQSLIGIVATSGAVVELPFMLFSGWFLRRYGPVRLLIVAMLLMISRFMLLGLMPAPEWAIFINGINGPAYVFFWNSAVTYANKMAPPSMGGTVQGLLIATTGLASVLSSLLTGWLFDRLGPNGMFQVMAVVVLAALLLFAGWRVMVRRAAAV